MPLPEVGIIGNYNYLRSAAHVSTGRQNNHMLGINIRCYPLLIMHD